MRNLLLALGALTLAVTTAAGQESWAWEKVFKDGQTHDFGSVPRGTQLYHRFKIKNIYAVPLELSARVGCYCVTVSPTTQVLQPRQEGYIDATMDTSRLTGHKSVNIYITAVGAPKYTSSTVLQVTAYSRTDVVVNPGQISFGVVARGQPTAPRSIEVEYAGVLDWRILEVVKHDAPLDVTVKELYRRAGQVGYQVAVAIKPDALAGPFKQELILKTNDPASPLLPVLVEANIQGSLSVAPNVVSMGSLKVGESVTKLVLVKANKPFRILAVEGQGEDLHIDLPSAALPQQVLRLKFQPLKPGEVRRQLRIKTDLDQEATASVQVEGTVEP